MINNGFDHFKYSVHIRFIRNTANPYSVYKKPNPNTANPYSVYKKTNPNSFISYSVYKKRNYSVPYIFGFGRIIRIRLTPRCRVEQNFWISIRALTCLLTSQKLDDRWKLEVSSLKFTLGTAKTQSDKYPKNQRGDP